MLPRSSRLPSIAVLVPILLTGCMASTAQEIQIGQAAAAEVESQMPILRDATVQRYVEGLGARLAARTGAEYPWTFRIVDSPDVNAFALPGGFIYVNRGLIERAGSAAELAGVLGHEIGHVVERHSAERMRDAERANAGVVLACTLTRFCEGQGAQTAVEVAGTAIFARFSREDELEADAVAVQLVSRAGIDPRGIPAMFRRLLAERSRSPGALDSWFATHPTEESRIQAAEARIANLGQGALAGLQLDEPEFQRVRQRLASLPRAAVRR